jgi:hypothetical protein
MADDNGNGKTASEPLPQRVRPLPPVTFQISILTQEPGDGFLTARKIIGLSVNVPLEIDSAKAIVATLAQAIQQADTGLQVAPAGAMPAPSSPLHIQR